MRARATCGLLAMGLGWGCSHQPPPLEHGEPGAHIPAVSCAPGLSFEPARGCVGDLTPAGGVVVAIAYHHGVTGAHALASARCFVDGRPVFAAREPALVSGALGLFEGRLAPGSHSLSVALVLQADPRRIEITSGHAFRVDAGEPMRITVSSSDYAPAPGDFPSAPQYPQVRIEDEPWPAAEAGPSAEHPPGSQPARLGTGPPSFVAAAAPEAEHTEDEEDPLEGIPCVLAPRRACHTEPFVELGFGWGESHTSQGWQSLEQGTIEAGILLGATGALQVGPVAALGFFLTPSGTGAVFDTKMKTRTWIAGSVLALDFALGARFESFASEDGGNLSTRAGPTGDIGMTLFGVAAPFVEVSELIDPGGLTGAEARVLLGVRGSLLGWGVLFAALAAAK